MKTATRFPKWPFYVFRNPPVRVAAVGGVAPVVAALSHVACRDSRCHWFRCCRWRNGRRHFERSQILREYTAEMTQKRDALVTALDEQLQHAIGLFYQDLSGTFSPLSDFCNAEKARFQPLVEKAGEIEKNLL